MRRLLATVATAILLSLSWVGTASAQGNPAVEHYKQGVALFEAGNYKAALAEFLESFEAKPNWKLRHTIGVCYFNINRFVDAQKSLVLYLEEGGNEIPEDKKAETEDMLNQISKLIAQVDIEVDVEGALIWIDEEKVATCPMEKPLILDAGVYALEITAAGYQKYKKDLKLAGGDKKELVIALVKKGGSVEPEGDGGEGDGGTVDGGKGDGGKGDGGKGDGGKGDGGKKPKEKKPKAAKAPKSKQEKLALGLMGGAIGAGVLAAGGGVMVVVEGLAVQDNKKKFDACSDAACQEFYKNDGETFKTLTNVFVIVTGVMAAAAIGLGVGSALAKKKAKKSEKKALGPQTMITFAPAVTPDGLYLGVVGTF